MQLGAGDSRIASESRPGKHEEVSIHHMKSRLESYWRISDLGALRLCLCLCCEAKRIEEELNGLNRMEQAGHLAVRYTKRLPTRAACML